MRLRIVLPIALAGVLVAATSCTRGPGTSAFDDVPEPDGSVAATTQITPEPTDAPKDDETPAIEDLTLKDKKKKKKGDKGALISSSGNNDGPAVAPKGPAGVEKPPPKLEPKGDGGQRFRTMSARVTESTPDGQRSGTPPDYAEARAVDIQGMGDNFRVTLTFFDDVPMRMPTNETYMVISFGLSGRKSDDGDYGFGARATEEGWLAYAGSKGSASQFPGTFFVRGNKIEMNIPWSAVGGPRPFQWYASSSWFEHRAGVTSYLFDPIPNGKANYPN